MVAAAVQFSKPSIPMKLALSIFTLCNFTAFVFQLAYTDGERTGSRLWDFVNLASDVTSLLIIVTSPNARRLTLDSKPLLAMGVLGLISSIWSIDPIQTFKAVRNFLSPCLLVLAMSGRYSPDWCFRFLIRSMALCCVLSVIWVFVFPTVAVHQATDRIQAVHAGLWRGVFIHKQELGPFAGQSLALSIFYRKIAFKFIVPRLIAVISGALCVWGSGSATGIVVFIVFSLLLYATYGISQSRIATRKYWIWFLLMGAATVSILQYMDLLGTFAPILGKSSDLTGRSSFYTYLRAQFNSSGYFLFGSGVGCGSFLTERLVGSPVGLDNGYLKTILELGYLGGLIFFWILLKIGIDSVNLVVADIPDRSPLELVPLAFFLTFLFENITEGLFMAKNAEAFLLAIIVVAARRRTVGRGAAGRLQRPNVESAVNPGRIARNETSIL